MSNAGQPRTPLKVCLWAPLPPPPGGISQWTLRYRAAAPAYGLRPVVLNTSPPAKTTFSERSRFDLGRVGVAGRLLKQLVALIRTDRPDVAHVTTTLFWATPREALALSVLRAAGIPSVLNLRASNQLIAWREGLDPVRRRGLDTCLRMASTVLVLSEELEAYLTQALPGLRVARIGNMVSDAERERPPGPNLLPETKRTRVLFVGAITPLKGVGDLCDAVLDCPDVELVLVGYRGGAIDPQRAAEMERSIARLHATGRLTETGHLEREDVRRAYHESDIFCLPSYREGMPNVLLEAMGSGLPCVATPVGAVPEVAAGGAVALAPVGDVVALRGELTALANDPERRAALAAAGRARIDERYAEAAVMGAYVELYRSLL